MVFFIFQRSTKKAIFTSDTIISKITITTALGILEEKTLIETIAIKTFITIFWVHYKKAIKKPFSWSHIGRIMWMLKFPRNRCEITIFWISDILAVFYIFTCDSVVIDHSDFWHILKQFSILLKKLSWKIKISSVIKSFPNITPPNFCAVDFFMFFWIVNSDYFFSCQSTFCRMKRSIIFVKHSSSLSFLWAESREGKRQNFNPGVERKPRGWVKGKTRTESFIKIFVWCKECKFFSRKTTSFEANKWIRIFLCNKFIDFFIHTFLKKIKKLPL